MSKVILCHESDAASMAERTRQLLAHEPIEVQHDDKNDPCAWDPVVFLALVSPDAFAEATFAGA